jgi:hypothetical protein
MSLNYFGMKGVRTYTCSEDFYIDDSTPQLYDDGAARLVSAF